MHQIPQFLKYYTIINSCTILAQLAELIVHNRLKAACVCVCQSIYVLTSVAQIKMAKHSDTHRITITTWVSAWHGQGAYL